MQPETRYARTDAGHVGYQVIGDGPLDVFIPSRGSNVDATERRHPHGAGRRASTVKDLVGGSGLRFVDRGSSALHGVPGEWRLFAVDGRARPVARRAPFP